MMQSSLSHESPDISASIHNLLCVSNEHKTLKGHPQSVTEPNTECSRAAGVLRYNRESDNYMLNSITTHQEAQCQAESMVKCEYCGKKACPLLDPTCKQNLEVVPHFCCTKRQQLSNLLMKLRLVFEADTTSEEDKTVRAMEELLCRGRDIEHHYKTQSGWKIYKDFCVPHAGTCAPAVKGLRFQLSCCAPENESQKKLDSSTPKNDLKTKEGEEPMWVSYCNHKPIHFGLCYQQPAGVLQKYYSSGNKFLTAFPDGSAQVFYPSGLLALVVVTEQNGRVCIVYHDNDAPRQTVRAVFQSDGRAACYHSNGNIWLVLNRSGGQCLTDAGAKTCQWNWGSGSCTPTPLRPFSLPLNKTVRVRILGNKQVFVSFMAMGQKATFSVGTCCTQGDCKTPGSRSSALKEERFVLAANIRISLVIQQLHQLLTAHSRSRFPKTKLAPHLRVAALKLLKDGADEETSDRDTAFIQKCLKDY